MPRRPFQFFDPTRRKACFLWDRSFISSTEATPERSLCLTQQPIGEIAIRGDGNRRRAEMLGQFAQENGLGTVVGNNTFFTTGDSRVNSSVYLAIR